MVGSAIALPLSSRKDLADVLDAGPAGGVAGVVAPGHDPGGGTGRDELESADNVDDETSCGMYLGIEPSS
jgi:hypothetical protein